MIYEQVHWAAFNILAKIFGLSLLVIAGAIALINGIQLLNGNVGVALNGATENRPVLKLGLVAVMAALSILGFLIVKAKFFRPWRTRASRE